MEFALCMPVLVLILIGIFDLGRVFNAYIVVTNASREGAYYGVLNPSDTDGIVAQAISEPQHCRLDPHSDNITVTSSGVSGSPMRVTVAHDFELITSYILGGQPIPLQSSTEMMVY